MLNNQVYLPAIRGLVPENMVRAIRAFLDFCYLVRRSVIDEDDIGKIEDALEDFHLYREIFRIPGVRPSGFSLPRQHSVAHYPKHVRSFAAPNGLCSSITESKHIKAVKKPWRRSNKFNALKQMLLTNQRLDKLAAARCDFKDRGMLQSSCIEQAYEDFNRALGMHTIVPMTFVLFSSAHCLFVEILDEDIDGDVARINDQVRGVVGNMQRRRQQRMAAARMQMQNARRWRVLSRVLAK